MKFESKWEILQIELQSSLEKLLQLVNLEEKENLTQIIQELNIKANEMRKLFKTALNKLEENEKAVETVLKQSHQLNNEIDELIEVYFISINIFFLEYWSIFTNWTGY